MWDPEVSSTDIAMNDVLGGSRTCPVLAWLIYYLSKASNLNLRLIHRLACGNRCHALVVVT
jgi:hypothetical protein